MMSLASAGTLGFLLGLDRVTVAADRAAIVHVVTSALGEGCDVIDFFGERSALADAFVSEHHRPVDLLLSAAGSHAAVPSFVASPCLLAVNRAGLEVWAAVA